MNDFMSFAMATKKCTKCLCIKPVADFGKHSQTKSGLKSRCKSCNSAEGCEYAAKNAEKVREIHSKYRQNNPEIARRSNNKRRALKREIKGNLSRGITKKLLVLQLGKCVSCSVDLAVSGHHMDHVIPLALGGAHCDSNLQLLCPACNLKKGAKHPIDWAQENGRLL